MVEGTSIRLQILLAILSGSTVPGGPPLLNLISKFVVPTDDSVFQATEGFGVT